MSQSKNCECGCVQELDVTHFGHAEEQLEEAIKFLQSYLAS
jgi:hypothetical protein